MTPDEALRGFLTAQALVALVLGGAILGTLWGERGWPVRTFILGGMGMLVYVLAGQAKAFLTGIPFDGFSWVGIAAYVILIVGAVWAITVERRGR